MFEKTKPTFLWPLRYQESGVKIYNEKKLMPGLTLITSYWKDTEWTPGIRLIDRYGDIIYHWNVEPEEIWPESPYNDQAKNTKNTVSNCIHGSFLYPNGDVVFNIEYLGLVKMNAKGEILWKLTHRTSHSVYQDEDGNFWVCGTRWIESTEEARRFPGLSIPYTEDTVLKVSPDGTILNEISILEALYNGNFQHLLYHNSRLSGDVLHLNDVEVLGSFLADKFPSLNEGDIVISMRELSTIAILDQNGSIKWICPGIFTKQHDPDFEANGVITVFDNRARLGTSMIREIKPFSTDVTTLYPNNNEDKFYSMVGGKHQLLKNGNRLITETCGGRIFEISPENDIVWEWFQQPYDKNNVVEVFEGTRYNLTKNDVDSWKK